MSSDEAGGGILIMPELSEQSRAEQGPEPGINHLNPTFIISCIPASGLSPTRYSGFVGVYCKSGIKVFSKP